MDYLSQLHPFFINVGKTLPILDILEVTEAVAHVIAVIPASELLKALQLFCMPLAQNLHDLAAKGKDATEKDRRDAAGKITSRECWLPFLPNMNCICNHSYQTCWSRSTFSYRSSTLIFLCMKITHVWHSSTNFGQCLTCVLRTLELTK